jgi:hypothetical protein
LPSGGGPGWATVSGQRRSQLSADPFGGAAGQPLSLFEYVTIAFSLIFSFSVMRLVGGIPHSLDPGRRYWLHALHVGFQLVASAGSFWANLDYRDLEEWTFPAFLLVLAGPSLFYFNATVLIPDAPATIESWRVHYFAVRRRYWIAICLWALVDATIDSALLDVPLAHPGRAVQGFFLALGVSGVISANVRVHEILALLVWLLPLAAIATAGRPGFSPQ